MFCLALYRYANEEDFFTAVLEMVTDSGTAMVTYEGFEEQDEVRNPKELGGLSTKSSLWPPFRPFCIMTCDCVVRGIEFDERHSPGTLSCKIGFWNWSRESPTH